MPTTLTPAGLVTSNSSSGEIFSDSVNAFSARLRWLVSGSFGDGFSLP